MFNNDTLIDVLYFGTSPVGIKTKERNYIFESANGDNPFILPLTMPEIRYANSTCNHFKNGLLTFSDDIKEEMYKELRIQNWEDIKSDADIENLLLNPTIEGLQWVIDIQDNQLFERIRGIMVGLINAGADITVKVKSIIQQRFEEFRFGKIKNSEIILRPKDVEARKDPKVDALEKQLADMKAMIEQMMAAQAATTAPVKEESPASVPVDEDEPVLETPVEEKSVERAPAPAHKKAGRPSNKRK